jgi:hypothetical protein
MTLSDLSTEQQNMLTSDFSKLLGDVENIYGDEVKYVGSDSNLYRILGSMAGVSLVSMYNGNNNVKSLAIRSGIFGLATLISIHLSNALQYKNYVAENREEQIILPASGILYYLSMSRNLQFPNRMNNTVMEVIGGLAGSFSSEYFFNNQKPKTN